MLDFTDKAAIVTGGARGIGEAICLTLARQGADVVVADILDEEGKRTEVEIKETGRRGVYIKTDVTERAQVEQMVQETMELFGKVDILVNNAGWDKIELFSRLDPALWDKIIDLNFKHQIYTTKAVIDHMCERRYGKIVNIGSDAGRVGSTGEAVYSGCKGAVIAFTKTMARELARFGINVNCVCPGPTNTPLTESQGKEEFASKLLQPMTKIVPLGRWAEPQDLANTVVFMASDEASYITGQVLSVSGGLTMC